MVNQKHLSLPSYFKDTFSFQAFFCHMITYITSGTIYELDKTTIMYLIEQVKTFITDRKYNHLQTVTG